MSLFPPPKDVKTEIFARVPDEFRKSGGRPAWGEANIPVSYTHLTLPTSG